MRQRLLYLCKFFLITVMLFIMAKIAFMLLDHEGHAFTVSDMFDVIWHGLSLDLSTALYILIVPFLVTLVSLWWDGKVLTCWLSSPIQASILSGDSSSTAPACSISIRPQRCVPVSLGFT